MSSPVDDRIEPSRAEPWRPQYVGARWVATVDSVGKQHWEVACDCSLCGATVMAPQQGVHTDFHERLYRSACRG